MMSVGLLFGLACTDLTAGPASLPTSQATATASPTQVPTATPTPTPSPTATPTLTPTPAATSTASSASETSQSLATPQGILDAAYAAMRDVESFHFDLDARIRQSSGGIESEIPMSFVGDVRVPDRVRGTLQVSLGFFTVRVETLVIGDTAYITDPQTGDWMIAPGLLSALPNPADVAQEKAPIVEDLTLIGKEVLNGATVYHLTGVPPEETLGDLGDEAEIAFWIGVEDLLLRRVATEGQIDLSAIGQSLGGAGISGTATVAITIVFSNYGKPVTIEAPDVP